MAKTKRRWPRRLARIAAAAALMAIALILAGKWCIAPALIRWQIDQALPEYWDGTAEIGQIDFNYFGPVSFGGVALRDGRGRTWLRAARVRLTLRDWPSLHPMLTRVEVDRPELLAHCTADRCDPPLRKIPSELWTEYVDLEAISVAAASMEVIEDGNSTGRFGPLDVRLNRGSGRYDLSLAPGHPLVVRDLRAETLVLTDERVEVRRLAGRIGEGRIVASIVGRVAPGGRIELSGHAAVRKVNLAPLEVPVRWAGKGLATGIFRFRGEGLSPARLRGNGSAFIESADLRDIPAAVEVLRRAGLGDTDVLRDSDLEVAYRLRGSVVTLDQARLRVKLAALDVEPGGVLDLRSGRMDLHAVVILFEKARNLLKSIPVVGLMVDLRESFSRYHLRGPWDQPDKLELTAEPLKGIQNGSKRFLISAAEGSSRLGKAILNGLGGLFRLSDPNTPATRPAGP